MHTARIVLQHTVYFNAVNLPKIWSACIPWTLSCVLCLQNAYVCRWCEGVRVILVHKIACALMSHCIGCCVGPIIQECWSASGS